MTARTLTPWQAPGQGSQPSDFPRVLGIVGGAWAFAGWSLPRLPGRLGRQRTSSAVAAEAAAPGAPRSRHLERGTASAAWRRASSHRRAITSSRAGAGTGKRKRRRRRKKRAPLSLSRIVLPKQPWLDHLGLNVVWPMQGIPRISIWTTRPSSTARRSSAAAISTGSIRCTGPPACRRRAGTSSA